MNSRVPSARGRHAPIRVLLAKPTQDCHDRGVRYLARKLRDAGFEVIFINFLLASEVAAVAEQEDVDAVGISSSSGGHLPVFEDLLSSLRRKGLGELPVFAGGVIPSDDAEVLESLGVRAVFGPGSSAEEFIALVLRESVARRGESV